MLENDGRVEEQIVAILDVDAAYSLAEWQGFISIPSG